MAYGKGGPGFGPNVKTFSFNLKAKDLPAPQFEVKTKEGDTNVTLEPATRVSGDLIGIRHKVFKYQNKDIESVTATLRDGNEVYFVSLPYTYLGRNIINSLAALKSFGGVEISVYRGKPKEPGKPGFDSSAVRQGGDLVYGKYEYKDLPAIPKVKVGKDVFSDATKVNELFKSEVEILDKAIKAKSPVVAGDSASADHGAPEGGDPEEASMPF